MSPTPKPTREPAMDEPHEPLPVEEVRNNFITLFTRGIDRLAEIQKRTLDIAVQQNVEMIDTYRKLALKVPGAPRMPMLEVATTVFERFADTQKHAIDLAVEQSHAMIDAAKDRTSVVNKAAEAAVNLTNQAVERTVAAQKKVVETTVAQTKAVLEATRKQMGVVGVPAEAVNSFQRGVDTFVEAQKELLDLVVR